MADVFEQYYAEQIREEEAYAKSMGDEDNDRSLYLRKSFIPDPCKCGFCDTDSDHFNHGIRPSVAQMRYLRSVCPDNIDFDTWAAEYKLHRYNLVTAEMALTGNPYKHGI